MSERTAGPLLNKRQVFFCFLQETGDRGGKPRYKTRKDQTEVFWDLHHHLAQLDHSCHILFTDLRRYVSQHILRSQLAIPIKHHQTKQECERKSYGFTVRRKAKGKGHSCDMRGHVELRIASEMCKAVYTLLLLIK